MRASVAPPLFVLQVMEQNAAGWEEHGRAPVRARGQEDGGGAPGPSTAEGENISRSKRGEAKMGFFIKNVLPTLGVVLGRAMRRKARRLALAEASNGCFCVVSACNCVKNRDALVAIV